MRNFLLTLTLSLVSLAAGVQAVNPAGRGFVHPGGLHTRADFDRIKAQLAAGNTQVTQAYNVLKAAAYAQPSVQTYPVETIVRGGGSGENYINAARGATMAYQNALRWQIEGNTSCAAAAVRILMAWARTTKAIGGDSNYALAAGLYGYQFAQAAELVRDYEGWTAEDFAVFCRWMLELWYPSSLGFLRGRQGTWENSGKWWQAPGHYWSNWGLCNALCVISIGVLLDDVFIYNQGMSYFKYDQVGNFTDPPTLHEVTGHGEADGGKAIWNDGLTEFLGNLVVTDVESPLETAAYGHLGQMNESGRDTGHSAMALGLAVDIAKQGWNQGDDLFAYMGHRLASGIEYVAAQTLSVPDLPWTDYLYGNNGYYYSDGRTWLMTEPALGAQMRPYWGTVIGIYEGVKGVRMPFAEKSFSQMGIDAGGQGSTSGGYDHLGYSVLMNTRDEQLCPPELVPTELTPLMEYGGSLTTNLIPSLTKERVRGLVNGQFISHSELGGLVNTYTTNNNTAVPTGQTLRLLPQLPEGEEDTGLWRWNTGETTRELTIETQESRIYRVHYTNARGVESQIAFSIAVRGDCTPTRLTPSVTYGGVTRQDSVVSVLYGKTVQLSVAPAVGWGTYKWSSGQTTQTITSKTVTADTEVTATYTNQGGAVTTQTFLLHPVPAEPYILIRESRIEQTEALAEEGQSVTLGLTLPSTVRASTVQWSTGQTGASIVLDNLTESREVTATFTLRNEEVVIRFTVLVAETEVSRLIEPGRYILQHVPSGLVLTGHGKGELATFEPLTETVEDDGQLWLLDRKDSPKYNFLTPDGELRLTTAAKTTVGSGYPFLLRGAAGSNRLALYTGSATSPKFWDVAEDGSILTSARTQLTAFPFILVAEGDLTAIADLRDGSHQGGKGIYDLAGRKWTTPAQKGFYLIDGKKVLIR